jgi:plasmid maintenance system antidote protein VapI
MHVRSQINTKMNGLAQAHMNKTGWSQKYLGKEMGLTEPEISKLISYKRNWTFKLIERFKAVTGEKVNLWVA